jgi:hypothetical protein
MPLLVQVQPLAMNLLQGYTVPYHAKQLESRLPATKENLVLLLVSAQANAITSRASPFIDSDTKHSRKQPQVQSHT